MYALILVITLPYQCAVGCYRDNVIFQTSFAEFLVR